MFVLSYNTTSSSLYIRCIIIFHLNDGNKKISRHWRNPEYMKEKYCQRPYNYSLVNQKKCFTIKLICQTGVNVYVTWVSVEYHTNYRMHLNSLLLPLHFGNDNETIGTRFSSSSFFFHYDSYCVLQFQYIILLNQIVRYSMNLLQLLFFNTVNFE